MAYAYAYAFQRPNPGKGEGEGGGGGGLGGYIWTSLFSFAFFVPVGASAFKLVQVQMQS